MNGVLSKTGRRVFLKNIFPVTFFSGTLQEKFQSNHSLSVIITAVISVCDFINVSLEIHCNVDLQGKSEKNLSSAVLGLITKFYIFFKHQKH